VSFDIVKIILYCSQLRLDRYISMSSYILVG